MHKVYTVNTISRKKLDPRKELERFCYDIPTKLLLETVDRVEYNILLFEHN